MLVGPVFTRELVTVPRRARLFLYRFAYAGVLFGVMCTAWLILTGTQTISNVGDMARFGGILFRMLAPLQLAMVVFFAALSTASSVAQEKDRKTLVLLLMTRLNNNELVLGKLLASLLHVVVMLLAGLPVFALAVLFGGVSFDQVWRVFAVTLATALVAGSLGSTIALWREKTFQTLALTALAIVIWVLSCEAIGAGVLGDEPGGIDREVWGVWLSPLQAVLEAASPMTSLAEGATLASPVTVFLLLAAAYTILLNALAIWRIRIWNPSRELRRTSVEDAAHESIWGVHHDLEKKARVAAADEARTQHVDAQLRERPQQPHRQVWNNPVLWREICTWAYGRKVIAIRVTYWLLFALTAAGLYWFDVAEQGAYVESMRAAMPSVARAVIPFFVVSLVIVNALAVTSITNERDGRSLDLLLVTDLAPHEFLFGKLGGIFWVTKEMIVLPILLCGYLWWTEALSLENFAYVAGGLLVMNMFVAVLGIHCGMTYANSRAAIGVSLGTVFFLFLGVTICILMMISFSGSFSVQLAPFLAFILGGGVGLYVALGIRNPSPAILLASLLLPFCTFYAITSFLLNLTLAVFLVMAVAYSFTTAAMMIPALSEFDFAMGRNAAADE